MARKAIQINTSMYGSWEYLLLGIFGSIYNLMIINVQFCGLEISLAFLTCLVGVIFIYLITHTKIACIRYSSLFIGIPERIFTCINI